MKVPSTQSVTDILDATDPQDRDLAAVHLLSPVNVVAGMQAWLGESGMWHFRGFQVPSGDLDLMRGLFLAAHEDGDQYLELDDWDGCQSDLLKAVRSGSGTVVTGLDCLFGLPDVYVARECPLGTAYLVAALVTAGPITAQPLVVDGTALTLTPRGRHLVVAPARNPQVGRLDEKVASLKAAGHAARLRQEWQCGAVDITATAAASELVHEYAVESHDGQRRATLRVGADLVAEHRSRPVLT